MGHHVAGELPVFAGSLLHGRVLTSHQALEVLPPTGHLRVRQIAALLALAGEAFFLLRVLPPPFRETVLGRAAYTIMLVEQFLEFFARHASPLGNCRPRHRSRIAQGPARARLHSSQVGTPDVYHFDARASRVRTATLLSNSSTARGTSPRSGFGRELPQLGEPTTRMTQCRSRLPRERHRTCLSPGWGSSCPTLPGARRRGAALHLRGKGRW